MNRPLKSESIDVGLGERLTPAQIIIMFGFLVYESPRAPEAARRTARHALSALLSAASTGGFASSDLLDTLMARAERSERVEMLAEDAVCAIGDATAFISVMQHAGISMEDIL
ncbi:hypothetical protein [Paraburkholderia bannensis]|uniref:hypothetical protein n=1 Tax=Paraburkholderia bannensis TaxID=765414 RepID=UPI002AC32042|nr:hypothetical protein [Paraburkholderia bannensis]